MLDNPQRILIVKLADIGDVLAATPALRALRESYPAAHLDLLTTPHAAPVVPGSLLDGVLTAPRNLATGVASVGAAVTLLKTLVRTRYDAVLILHHLTLWAGVLKYRLLAAASGAQVLAGLDNGKGAWLTHPVADRGFGALHEVEYWLEVARKVGASVQDDRLAVQFSQRDIAWAHGVLRDLPRPWIVLHAGSGGYSMARRWDVVRWAAAADSLVEEHGASILLVGTATDGGSRVAGAMKSQASDLTSRTSLTQLAALLNCSDLFVGADSGIMHVAAAAGTPIVALFGPSNHLAWQPWVPSDRLRVVRLGLGCSPCSYIGHQVGQRDGCWHRSCMADLPVDRVLQACQGFLGRFSGNRPVSGTDSSSRPAKPVPGAA